MRRGAMHTAREIPGERPELLAEIAAPAWRNVTGDEPAIVHGRIFAWTTTPEGGQGLYEVTEESTLARRLSIAFEGSRTALPVAVGDGFGAAWAPVDGRHPLEAIVADADWTTISRHVVAEAVSSDSLGRIRASAGALVVCWRGNSEPGSWRRGIVALDATSRRFALDVPDFLEACGETLLVAHDVPDRHAFRGLDAHTGVAKWSNLPSRDEVQRGEVGANGESFFVVEHFRLLDDTFVLRAVDPRDGSERWQTPLRGTVAEMRAGGPVIAVLLHVKHMPWTWILDARTGAVVVERERPLARNTHFPILAVDHTHLLVRERNTLLCERHTGELAWSLPLPEIFARKATFQFACDGGRLVLRDLERLWIFG